MLRAENIQKDFMRLREGSNHFCAVQEVSLTLAPGQVVEITGRSGSGKSTLLNMLAGLLRPTSGTVWLEDTDLYSLPDAQLSLLRGRKLGVIPQGQTALHSLSVLENVLLPRQIIGEKPDRAAALRLLEGMGIAALANERPAALSGGELRRVAIARALINQPAVLLADEPTGDLDDENTRAVLQLLRNTAQAGTAVLLVTHEPEAARYADLVYRMDGGRLTLQE